MRKSILSSRLLPGCAGSSVLSSAVGVPATVFHDLPATGDPTQPVIVSQFQAFLADIINIAESHQMRCNLAVGIEALILLLRIHPRQIHIQNRIGICRRRDAASHTETPVRRDCG